jgi:ankyrin repeat protein
MRQQIPSGFRSVVGGASVLLACAPVQLKSSPHNERLFNAVHASDIKSVQAALSAGADVNARDRFRRTPLHLADSIEIAKMLLDHGASLRAKDKFGKTAADYAKVDVELVSLLEAARPHNERLFNAVHTSAIKSVQAALSAGADVNARDKFRRTPLHLAYSIEIAKMLLDFGASLRAKDKFGKTAADCPRR